MKTFVNRKIVVVENVLLCYYIGAITGYNLSSLEYYLPACLSTHKWDATQIYEAGDATMVRNLAVDADKAAGQELDMELHDCPESLGALYAQRKALQLASIKWTPLSDVPHNDGFFSAGTQIMGLPYSSARETDTFIGIEVSLETFMTALQNPASVLYTRNLRNPDDPDYNSGNTNCATYYGVVCSTFARYVLGIDFRYSTRNWHEIPGMKPIHDQSPYGVKIADSLCTQPNRGGHVMYVHDIVRTINGRIKWIEIIEAVRPHVKRTRYTPETFMDLLKESGYGSGYVIYRYDGIVNNTYEPSEYVAVDHETAVAPAVNAELALDRGNKSNYRLGEEVHIHVMDTTADHLIIQFRDDTLVKWQTVSTAFVRDISASIVNGSAYTIYSFVPENEGQYRAYCVTRDGLESGAVLWQIVNISTQITDSAAVNEQIAVAFPSSENVIPLYISWGDITGISYKCQPITENEAASGQTHTSFEHAGTWYVKVFFRTRYGRLASVKQAVTLSPDI